MRFLRQSTSVDLPIGPFLDPTDGVTAETGLTLTQPDIRLKKNGGAWAQKAAAQTLSHEENGWYEVTLDATDTNTLGLLQLAVVESGAAPVWHEFMVLAPAAWDALLAGTGNGIRADVQVLAAGSIVAATLGADAITAAKVAADVHAEAADAVWDEALSGHATAGTAGQRLQVLDSGTAQAGAAGSITLRSGANATDNFYQYGVVHITGGTGAGQSRVIPSYTGATKVALVEPNWVVNPDNTSVYDVLPGTSAEVTGPIDANVTEWDGDAVNALISGRVDVNVGAMQTGVVTAAALAADAVDEIFDEQIGDGTLTMRQVLRIFTAAVAGRVSGAATTTVTFRNGADSADVIVATVDASGNRSAVTLTP